MYTAHALARSLKYFFLCGSNWIMAEALQTTLDGTPSGAGEKLRDSATLRRSNWRLLPSTSRTTCTRLCEKYS